jgi:uncharacterized protein YjbJ (UPF0337 family)
VTAPRLKQRAGWERLPDTTGRGHVSTDETKGRLKEAVGDLKDDDDLKREGQVDQIIGNVKKKTDDVGDKAKDAVTSDDD